MSQTRKNPVTAGLKRILKTPAYHSTHAKLLSLRGLYVFDGALVGYLNAGVLR